MHDNFFTNITNIKLLWGSLDPGCHYGYSKVSSLLPASRTGKLDTVLYIYDDDNNINDNFNIIIIIDMIITILLISFIIIIIIIIIILIVVTTSTLSKQTIIKFAVRYSKK